MLEYEKNNNTINSLNDAKEFTGIFIDGKNSIFDFNNGLEGQYQLASDDKNYRPFIIYGNGEFLFYVFEIFFINYYAFFYDRGV